MKVQVNRVLRLQDAADASGICKRTLQRYIADGTGPSTVALSARAVGVLESDLNDWLLSRRRAAPGSNTAAA